VATSPKSSLTKGAATRQRIVELAAPVFNQRGYVGASMRDLVDATGLEKGGIYNHFGSKEQLALEAYDHAMSIITSALQRSQKPEHDAIQRLQSMIRDGGQRSMLFEMDVAIQQLGAEKPAHPSVVSLTGVYHNLLRHWAEM